MRRPRLVCSRKKGSRPPPPKFVHLLCGMELRRRRRRLVLPLMLRVSLSLSLSIVLRFETLLPSSSSSRPFSFCTCTSKHFWSSRTSRGPIDLLSASSVLCTSTSWSVCGTFRACNLAASVPPHLPAFVCRVPGSFILFLLNAIFFFVIITVNNGVAGDRRYHRCNALLVVSDSCGRA